MNTFGDYTTKLKTLLAAGTGPDVLRLSWSNVFPLDLAIKRHYYHQPRWSEAREQHIGPALTDITTGKQGAAQVLRAIKGPVDELLQQGAALMH